MTITEQARAAAEEIKRMVMRQALAASPEMTEDEVVTEWAAIITKHVHPPSLTEAIEEVRDYRKWYDESLFTPVTVEETQAVHQQFNGMVDRISAEAARHTIDKLVEALESLQGKAGVSEQVERLFFCPYCRTPISCDGVGHKVNDAATTPASVEACCGCEPARSDGQVFRVNLDCKCTCHAPEQQSPRVCPHLHQTFPGAEANACLDCGVRLP